MLAKSTEDAMRYVHLPPHPGTNTFKAALLAGGLTAFASGVVSAQPIEDKGTTPYVAHLVFRPLMSKDIESLRTVASLEAVPAHCTALNVSSANRQEVDGVCVLTDSDGDKIFSTFDTPDMDKSQPKMVCGTHVIAGGSGKYKGLAEAEPFACIAMPALVGPSVETAMNATREIKR